MKRTLGQRNFHVGVIDTSGISLQGRLGSGRALYTRLIRKVTDAVADHGKPAAPCRLEGKPNLKLNLVNEKEKHSQA